LSHLNVLILRDQDVQKILLYLLDAVYEMASKWNSGSFNFCSCTGFADSLGKKAEFTQFSNQKCNTAPPSQTPKFTPPPPRIISKGKFENLARSLELQALELDQQAETLEQSME
jgi:hypothetical protein